MLKIRNYFNGQSEKVSSRNDYSESFEILRKDENGKLELDTGALKFIRNIEGSVGVCLIVGSYRSGKSFLLNRLFHEDNQAFQVGHRDLSQTKGLCMSRKTINVSNKGTLLIIDTEVK